MIKINLIREGRKPVAAKKASRSFGDVGDRTADLLLAALAILGLLAVLGHFAYLKLKVRSLKAEVKTAQVEVDRLEPILREVEEFKAKKAELERKVQVINTLKANQRGPVQIMDEVSRALPDLLWLRRMQVAGTNVKLTGQAYNNNAIANFIEALDEVPEFQEPVLRDSQRRGDALNFVIDVIFTIQRPESDAADEAALASGG